MQITQESEYPEDGKSTLIVKSSTEWNGKINIRIPVWVNDFQVRLNGEIVSNSNENDDYYGINLQHLSEYEITIQFNVPVMLKPFEGNNYVMRRGPEVLSIDARDNIDTWLGANDDLVTIPKEIVGCIIGFPLRKKEPYVCTYL